MCLSAAGGLGRRASDGGANLQMFFQRQLPEGGWSHPNSQEQITQVSINKAVKIIECCQCGPPY